MIPKPTHILELVFDREILIIEVGVNLDRTFDLLELSQLRFMSILVKITEEKVPQPRENP